MTFVSMPVPEISFPISSTIRRSTSSKGSFAIQARAFRRSSRSPASSSPGRNASISAVSSYPFSTTPSPKAMRPLRSIPAPSPVIIRS